MKIPATFCLLLLQGLIAYSQSDTTIYLSDLIISENRLSVPFSESSRNVQIITRESIDNKPVQSIPEILQYAPGVDIRQRGPMGVQSDIGIRGGTFEQTLILLNGVKLTDPQTGHHIMNIPVPLDNIHQIQILKGPAARIFGQNAFAGAVNFITKVPEYPSLGLRAYGGSFGSYGVNVSLALPAGQLRNSISVSHDASDGFRHNTDYLINNIFYQGEIQTGKDYMEIMAGYTTRKFGANGFYASPNFTEQYEEVTTIMASVAYRLERDRLTLRPRLYWRNNTDLYQFVREQPGIYQNLHTTNTIAFEVNGTLKSSLGTTGIGVETRKEMISGEWIRRDVETKSNLDGYYRDNFGIFVDQKFDLGSRLDITPGIYVNWYSDFGWNAFPGVDFGYRVNQRWRVFGNIGKSYRVPTFYDQYYSSPVEQGNPDLMPEEAMTYEIGVRYLKKGLALEGNYFLRNASQLIDWVFNPTDSIWRSANLQNVLAQGIELVLDVNLREMVHPQFPVHQVNLSYHFINQELKQVEDLQSRYSLENIRHQVIAAIDHKIVGPVKNSLRLRYIDRVEQSPYFLVDDRIYYEGKQPYTVFVEAVNLTNQAYTEVMTPMPGRWIRGGITFKLNL